jgi:hypothetical protein
MKLLKFSQYITEAREIQPHEEEDLLKMRETVDTLNYMVEMGYVDQSGYRSEIRDISKTFNKFVKGLGLDLKDQADLERLKELGEKAGQSSLKGLSSPGARALYTKGLHMVSSPTQLANGSLVFSLDPEYRRGDGWGIGFFPVPKVIRRMTPKQINIGVWSRRYGSMDINIKHFKETATDLEFYDKAMLWAAENIDFEYAALYPEKSIWKYYKKHKTPVSRNEADDLRVEADEIDSAARIIPFQTHAERLPALENHLKAWQLRLKAAELEAASRAIEDAKHRIADLQFDITNIKNSRTSRSSIF